MRTHFAYFRGFHGREEGRGERQREDRHCGGRGEFGGGRHGFRGGRGGPLRFFGAGDLRYVILQLISEKPSHGYEIIKSIQERLGGTYAPSPGVVYPMLTMLEEMGHATVVTEGTRKLYTITEEGSKALAENKAQVDALFARMDQVRGEQGGDRAQQIERAVANFRMALRMKKGPLTEEQIHAITDIIDAAAKQIERA
jgi:DNA-binding PadR family transcriptional regulator